MRIFVSELLTSGAWEEPDVPNSLFEEGAAMLRGIVTDLARIPNCRVATTWDARFGERPFQAGLDHIDVRIVGDPAEEAIAFEEECRQADAALMIAPEFANLLADRCQRVIDLGTASLNCSVEAIRLCGDKLQLSRRLESLGIPSIPTRELGLLENADPSEFDFPLVVKPRDGAGSQETYLICDAEGWIQFVGGQAKKNKDQTGGHRDVAWIVQPFVPGRTLSIAALVGEEEQNGEPWREVFPLAEQVLTQDGRFGYLGGRIPETIFLQYAATQLVREAVRQIPGLSGYVGLDLIAPRNEPEKLWIVEINPRLTTSYLGYRELAEENIAEYLVPALRPKEPIRWRPDTVQFTAAGKTSVSRKPRGRMP